MSMPPRSYDEIRNEWLLGNATPMSPEDWLTAFVWCEGTLGEQWIDRSSGGRAITDPYTVAAVWHSASVAIGIPGGSQLLQKLGPNLRAANLSVLAELQWIAHFARHGAEVVIEPEVPVGTRRRRPDLAVTGLGPKLYVEIASPAFGAQCARCMGKVQRTLSAIDAATDRHVEVYLFREPSEEEVEQVAQCLKGAANGAYSMGNLAMAYVSASHEERLVDFAPAVAEQRPVLVAAELAMEGGNVTRRTVKLPFSDDGARAFVRGEAIQLPPEGPGLIVLDLSAPAGRLQFWRDAVIRYLHREAHTRVSGICLSKVGNSFDGVHVEADLVLNPRAAVPLTEEVQSVVSKFGSDWPFAAANRTFGRS